MEILLNGELHPLNTEAYEEWRQWRKSEKRVTIGATAEKLQHKLLTQFPPEVQREIIEHSIMNSYQGLFGPKGKPKIASSRDSSFEDDLASRDWAN